jgi:hypothetical protein
MLEPKESLLILGTLNSGRRFVVGGEGSELLSTVICVEIKE